MRTPDLFTADGRRPRRRRRVMMHATHADESSVAYKCLKCGHWSGYMSHNKTFAQVRRGKPCPHCNHD